MIMNAYSPSTQDVTTEGSPIRFEASTFYTERPYHQKTETKQNPQAK